MIELAKRNIHPHYLGTEATQKRIRTFGIVRKKPRLLGCTRCLESRSMAGIGVSAEAASSLDSFSTETAEAAKKIIKLVEDKKKVLFTPSRENCELNVALGNKEHTGLIRGKGEDGHLEGGIG
jgi:hypothetical protein